MGLGLLQGQVQSAPAYPASQASQLVAAPSHLADATSVKRWKQSWSWYVSRAAGLLAAVLLALLIISGIGLLTGYTYRIIEPLPAWAAHRAVGLAFGFMVLVHIFVLLLDKYIGFGLADVLVPFHSGYMPLRIGGVQLGSTYMALGILALYAIIIIIATSLLWMQKKPKSWRLLHYLSYFVFVAVFIHGLAMGTDMKPRWAQFLWVSGTIILLASIATRLRRAHTIRKDT
jgi:sulfoxide reductase heme-binding subunit YedZ